MRLLLFAVISTCLWSQGTDRYQTHRRAVAGAVSRTLAGLLDDLPASAMDFGARGDGTTDDSGAFQAAVAVSKTVLVPPGNYRLTSTVTLTSGQSLVCAGAANRWRSGTYDCKISYAGTGAAIQVKPGAGQGADTIVLRGLQIDGTASSGDVDGVVLDGTASGAYIEGVLLDHVSITNFPRSQLYAAGVVFDLTLQRLTAMNPDRAVTGDLIYIYYPGSGGAASQVTCDDCWLAPYTAGTWAFKTNITSDVRFIGGTVAPYAGALAAAGANGIYVVGGLSVLGTHVECLPGRTGQVGIQYLGTNGAHIIPSQLSACNTGVMTGDGTAAAASGAYIGGGVGNNTVDVQVTPGGSRQGTFIASTGTSGGVPVIQNLRASVNNVCNEVINLNTPGVYDYGCGSFTIGAVAATTGTFSGDVTSTGGTGNFYGNVTGQALLSNSGLLAGIGSNPLGVIPSTNKLGFFLRAPVGQTLDMLQIQNSGASAIAGFMADGRVYSSAGLSLTGSATIVVPSGSTPLTGTFVCPGGQHIFQMGFSQGIATFYGCN